MTMNSDPCEFQNSVEGNKLRNPTTGEWTAEYVHDLERWGWKRIADEHNAALAAERERYDNLQRSLVDAGNKMRLSCGIAEDCMEWDAVLAKVKEGK